jgi:hypothetical protein
MQTTFADTILNIAITGNLVRLDLGTVTPVQTQDGKQELRATPTQQVVMPMDGFVRAFGMQEQVIKKLIADGVLKAQPAPENQPSINTGTTTTTQ